MSNREIARKVFDEELKYIQSRCTKSFTLSCFDKLTPDYFWDFSASSSHKHHPQACNGEHGIVIHTKLCVWWGRKLADNFGCTDLDIIISSLLLHDLQKFGKLLDKDKKPTLARYWETHGPMLAIQMRDLYDNYPREIEAKNAGAIIACVALHMGRFTNESLSFPWKDVMDENNKLILQIVQLADYAASRKIDSKLKEFDNYVFPGREI